MVTTIDLNSALGACVAVKSVNIGPCVIIAADILDCTIANACLASGTFTKITGIGTQTIDVNVTDVDIVTGATTGTIVGKAVTCKVGFFGAAPVLQQSAPTAACTSITHTAPTCADFALQDLVVACSFGFVTKDEGNTVLQVILNLQTRMTELETQMSNTGLSA